MMVRARHWHAESEVTTQSNAVPTDRTTDAFRACEPKARVLVVDADDDTRALYREAFQLSGCDVVEASDGRDAQTKALVSPPCLVVTAIRLRVLDGYALCQILRGDPATAHIPILVVTAEVGPDENTRAREAGADAVLAKPTTPEHILSEARRILAEMKDVGKPGSKEAKLTSRLSSPIASRSSRRRGVQNLPG